MKASSLHVVLRREQHGINPRKKSELLALRTILILLPFASACGSLLPGIGSLFAFRILTLAYAASSLFAYANIARSGRAPSLPFVVIWGLFCGAGLITAPDQGLALKTSVSVFLGLLLILSMELTASSQGVLRSLEIGWLLAIAGVLLVGSWEAISGSHLPNYFNSSEVERIDTRLIASVFGNPNAFAVFLVSTMPMLFAAIMRARTNSGRAGGLALTLVATLMLILTGSRLGLISFALEIVTFLLLLGAKRALIAVLVGIVTLGSTIYLAGEQLLILLPAKVGQFLDQILGPNALRGDGSTEIRMNLYKDGLWLVGQSNGMGYGPGQTQWALSTMDLPFLTNGVVSPHNGYLEIAIDLGLIALASLLIWLWLSARATLSLRRSDDPRARAVAVLVICSLVGCAPMAIANSGFLASSSNWMYFATIGAYASMYRPVHSNGVP